jgi:hypothetical protein
MRWAAHVTSKGETKISYKNVLGKPLGQNWNMGQDNIEVDLKGTG